MKTLVGNKAKDHKAAKKIGTDRAGRFVGMASSSILPRATLVRAQEAPFKQGLSLVAENLVLKKAIEVIGDREDAMRWMGTPVRNLGYATPVSLLGTNSGREAVLTVLTQLEHGVL